MRYHDPVKFVGIPQDLTPVRSAPDYLRSTLAA